MSGYCICLRKWSALGVFVAFASTSVPRNAMAQNALPSRRSASELDPEDLTRIFEDGA